MRDVKFLLCWAFVLRLWWLCFIIELLWYWRVLIKPQRVTEWLKHFDSLSVRIIDRVKSVPSRMLVLCHGSFERRTLSNIFARVILCFDCTIQRWGLDPEGIKLVNILYLFVIIELQRVHKCFHLHLALNKLWICTNIDQSSPLIVTTGLPTYTISFSTHPFAL